VLPMMRIWAIHCHVWIRVCRWKPPFVHEKSTTVVLLYGVPCALKSTSWRGIGDASWFLIFVPFVEWVWRVDSSFFVCCCAGALSGLGGHDEDIITE
jgi:hypothetical protein